MIYVNFKNLMSSYEPSREYTESTINKALQNQYWKSIDIFMIDCLLYIMKISFTS